MATLQKPVKPKTMISGWFLVYMWLEWTSFKNIWVLKDHEISFGGETVDDIYTNYKTKKTTNADQVNFSFSLNEQRPEIIEILRNWLSTRTSYDGSTTVANQIDTVIAWSLVFGEGIRLSVSNWDKSAVTINSITINSKTLVVDEDYTITTNEFGRSIVTIIDPATGGYAGQLDNGDLDYSLVIDYQVTPEASSSFTTETSGFSSGIKTMLVRSGKDNAGAEMRMELEIDNCSVDMSYTGLIGDSDPSTASYQVNVSGYVAPGGERFINFD